MEFFGADDRWRDHLRATPTISDCSCWSRLADNTARRNCGRAKQFFRAAVRKRLIRENPFADMKGCGSEGESEPALLRHAAKMPSGSWMPAPTPSGGCCSL